jgi:hypothetical protein
MEGITPKRAVKGTSKRQSQKASAGVKKIRNRKAICKLGQLKEVSS